MVETSRGQELHRRACDGDQLSEEERRNLDAWYAEMDAEEAKALGQGITASPTIEEMRFEARDRLAELQATIEKISVVEESNAVLRRQNEELKRQLVAKGILAA
jgi:hypothetical protein